MKNIQEIFKRYLEGSCTPEELKFLLAHFRKGTLDRDLLEQLEAEFQRDESGVNVSDELQHLVNRNRHQLKLKIRKNSSSRYRYWLSIAAAMIVLSAVTFYFWTERSNLQFYQRPEQITRITPERNKAAIITTDGSAIDLSSQQTGIVIDGENGMSYTDGSPVKGIAADDLDRIPVFELITPKGGTYQITLSDGTRVWLNAASRLSYPQRFNGPAREVTLRGEAYFEVAENKDQPFTVRSKGQQVTVIGTEFNIAAYEDEESTRTTLINGSIKVDVEDAASTTGARTVWLRPGEQSVLIQSGLISLQVDPLIETAWRSNKFYFENQTIESVMRQLARWYDIEVVYEKGVQNRRFSGSISRFSEIEEVLYNLELTKTIRFQITGRSVTVMP